MEKRVQYEWLNDLQAVHVFLVGDNRDVTVSMSFINMDEDLDLPERLHSVVSDMFKGVCEKVHAYVRMVEGKVREVSLRGHISGNYFQYIQSVDLSLEDVVKVLEKARVTLVNKFKVQVNPPSQGVASQSQPQPQPSQSPSPAAQRLFRYLQGIGLTSEEACVMIDMAASRILKSKMPITDEDYNKVYEHLRFNTPSRAHLATLVYKYAALKGLNPPQSESEMFNILKALRNDFFNTYREKIRDAEVFKQLSTDWSMVWYYFILRKIETGEFPPHRG